MSRGEASWTDKELLGCFRMPAGLNITGRASTIRNAFVAAIIPVIPPTAQEIGHVLRILGTEPENLRCACCGDSATEWDHLQPLVEDGRPTGYITSIRNRVPACGKCNQSKGKSPWKQWMRGGARLSPNTRGICDLEERIARLEAYEQWAQAERLDVEPLASADLWRRYYDLQNQILGLMQEAQSVAQQIAEQVRSESGPETTPTLGHSHFQHRASLGQEADYTGQ